MKTKTKIILDEWVGRSFVIILNLAARLLGALLRIDHSLEKVPKHIVVCKFLGMGSIIQATPLLQTLRKNFPEARITFITSLGNRSLLQSIDCIDNVLYVDDRNFSGVMLSTFSLLKHLWTNRSDLYIDLETYSYYSTALSTMSLSTNRFGFYRADRNIKMGVYTHMMFFNPRTSISQSYLQMARLAGCRDIVDHLFTFRISDDDRQSIFRKLFKEQGKQDRPIIVINPNASDLRIERRWSAGNFVSLLRRLMEESPNAIFLLTGSSQEIEWVKGIHEDLGVEERRRVINTAGSLSLHELFALIDASSLVITNDTGPMHISFAMGKPTISLFGPASPTQYGQNPNSFGIYKNLYCSPCVHDFLKPPCRGDNQCMKQISVDEVFALCKRILENKDETGRILSPSMQYYKGDDQTSLGIVERNPGDSR